MSSSWRLANSVVEAELRSETERYKSEGALKDKVPSEDHLTACLAPLLNFLAAESAMSELYSDLEKV